MPKPSREDLDRVIRVYKDELNRDIDDAKAEDFIRRDQALAEWYIEVTSQPGFSWPEDGDPLDSVPEETA